MMEPGLHLNIPMADYLRIPALSASLIKTLVDRCPAAAWYESWKNPDRVDEADDPNVEESERKRTARGQVAHAILLEGSEAGCVVIDPRDHPTEKTGNIPNGWTNKSIKAARDAARADGKAAILAPDMIEIRAMVASAKRYIDTLKETEPAIWRAFQPDGGASEVSIVWGDGGQLCKMRPDRLSTDGTIIVDPKFTDRSAAPGPWGKSQLYGMGYFISAGWYRRGIKALFDRVCSYYFLVVETCPPYLVSLIGVDPAWLELADSKIDTARALWRQCELNDAWPAYPNRACYPDLPGWAAAEWEATQASDAFGIPYDPAKLFAKS